MPNYQRTFAADQIGGNGESGACELTLDHIDLDRLDADADFFEPLDRRFDVGALAIEFQAHNPDFIGHARLANVGDHAANFGELPDQRLLDELGRIHQPQAGSAVVRWRSPLVLRADFLDLVGMNLTSGDGGNDADFVAIFERRLLVLQKANVFLVHINIHEPAHFAFFIDQTFLDAGIAGLQFDDGGANGGGFDLHNFLVVGQFAQRSWNSYFFCHKLIMQFTVRQVFIAASRALEFAQAGLDFARLAHMTNHCIERLQAVAGDAEHGGIIRPESCPRQSVSWRRRP